MYYIGKIIKPHGLKGEVKVFEDTDFPRFNKGKKIFINIDDKMVNLTIEQVKDQGKNLIIKFREFSKIEEVENLRGFELFTDEKPILDENEWEYQALIGLEVYTDDGQYVGIIKDILLALQQTLVIYNKAGKRILVPFVKEFVLSVDKFVTIKPIEGLLWLLILLLFFQKCLKIF